MVSYSAKGTKTNIHDGGEEGGRWDKIVGQKNRQKKKKKEYVADEHRQTTQAITITKTTTNCHHSIVVDEAIPQHHDIRTCSIPTKQLPIF